MRLWFCVNAFGLLLRKTCCDDVSDFPEKFSIMDTFCIALLLIQKSNLLLSRNQNTPKVCERFPDDFLLQLTREEYSVIPSLYKQQNPVAAPPLAHRPVEIADAVDRPLIHFANNIGGLKANLIRWTSRLDFHHQNSLT